MDPSWGVGGSPRKNALQGCLRERRSVSLRASETQLLGPWVELPVPVEGPRGCWGLQARPAGLWEPCPRCLRALKRTSFLPHPRDLRGSEVQLVPLGPSEFQGDPGPRDLRGLLGRKERL